MTREKGPILEVDGGRRCHRHHNFLPVDAALGRAQQSWPLALLGFAMILALALR
jgi:hypothetical protein